MTVQMYKQKVAFRRIKNIERRRALKTKNYYISMKNLEMIHQVVCVLMREERVNKGYSLRKSFVGIRPWNEAMS